MLAASSETNKKFKLVIDGDYAHPTEMGEVVADPRDKMEIDDDHQPFSQNGYRGQITNIFLHTYMKTLHQPQI